MKTSRLYFFEKTFLPEHIQKAAINLVGKSSLLLTGTNKKKSRRDEIVER